MRRGREASYPISCIFALDHDGCIDAASRSARPSIRCPFALAGMASHWLSGVPCSAGGGVDDGRRPVPAPPVRVKEDLARGCVGEYIRLAVLEKAC
jgi:hypothetical protein